PLGLLKQRPDMQQMIVCGFALAPELTDEAAFDTQPEFGAGGVQRKGDVLFVHGALLHRMWQWWRGASSNTVGKAATIQFHNHNVKPVFGFLTCCWRGRTGGRSGEPPAGEYVLLIPISHALGGSAMARLLFSPETDSRLSHMRMTVPAIRHHPGGRLGHESL